MSGSSAGCVWENVRPHVSAKGNTNMPNICGIKSYCALSCAAQSVLYEGQPLDIYRKRFAARQAAQPRLTPRRSSAAAAALLAGEGDDDDEVCAGSSVKGFSPPSRGCLDSMLRVWGVCQPVGLGPSVKVSTVKHRNGNGSRPNATKTCQRCCLARLGTSCISAADHLQSMCQY